MTLPEYDAAVIGEGWELLCGVDEAGRGPLAGPVYAAAVILLPARTPKGLADSKKLSAKRRETLYDQICEEALAYCVAHVGCEEIDRINILEATLLAMREAVAGLPAAPSLVLVDGNRDPGLCVPTRLLVGGDGLSACVAAASILAKVERDRYMLELDRQYPQYEFSRHKGYGTKAHFALLERYGPCPAHRQSFLSKWRAASCGRES